MRFVQYLKQGRKYLGLLSEDGLEVADLSDTLFGCRDLKSIIEQQLTTEELQERVKNAKYEKWTPFHELLPPLETPEKIICIGINYRSMCEERGVPVPFEPMFYSKLTSSITHARAPIQAHRIAAKLDYEVELAVIIGKTAKGVKKHRAMEYVFGYSVAQSITTRDWQLERNGGQFMLGKSMDTFCPMGPTIVHKSLVLNVDNINMVSKVNGVVKQRGNTSDMIFKIDDIISRLSKTITLRPGDIILTGTPRGSGQDRNPPEYLQVGDVVETVIEGLGVMRNVVGSSLTCSNDKDE